MTNRTKLPGALTSTAKEEEKHYPTPLRCCGDYCNFEASQSRRATSAIQVAELLLTRAEFDVLGEKIQNILKLVEHPDRTVLHTMTYKSIALAKLEKRGQLQEHQATEQKVESHMRSTESRSIQSNWQKKAGAVTGGASNYYRQIKVCSRCQFIYSILDRAREYLTRESEREAAIGDVLRAKEEPLPSSNLLKKSISKSTSLPSLAQKEHIATVEENPESTIDVEETKTTPKASTVSRTWRGASEGRDEKKISLCTPEVM